VKTLPRGDRKDWKEVPLEHYTALYKKIDPQEAAARCALQFDNEKNVFLIRLMGSDYNVHFPEFTVENATGNDDTAINEKILLLRYLIEGVWTAPRGKALSYREVPWGEVYFKNFEGRCINRLARTYGNSPETFCSIMDGAAGMNVEKIETQQYGYRFEFISNLYMSLIIWPGDDEFPPSAQILFDDNVPKAFTAEDLASVCDVVLTRLKRACP
jgi:hypothetical protein